MDGSPLIPGNKEKKNVLEISQTSFFSKKKFKK